MKKGFTLLEVMIALAVVGGLLVTLIYTVNYNLGIAERHEFATTATLLAREKIIEAEKTLSAEKGTFPEPYSGLRFETEVKDSQFPGVAELSVTVTDAGRPAGKDGREAVTLIELVVRKK